MRVAKVQVEVANALNGWSRLALNPIETQIFAASSPNFVKDLNQDDKLASI